MRAWWALPLAAVGVVVATPAGADDLDDSLGPREVALGEGLRAGAMGSLATTLNPAGLPLTRELVFEGSYGYRDGDAASLVGVSACDSTNTVPGCFYYRYANASPDANADAADYNVHVAGLALARTIGSRLLLGVGTKYVSIDAMAPDEAADSGFTWDLGALLRLTETLNLGAVGYNLFGLDSPQFPRAIGGGFFMKPSSQISLGVDARWDLDAEGETGRYGGGGEYFVVTGQGETGYPLRLGVVHDVVSGTYVTGGLGISTTKVAIDIGARRQVADGEELLLVASLRIFGPRM